jgi:FMN phosphatase YigB (HAD superfamily)
VEASCVKVLACPPREPIELVARIFVEKYLGVVARPARELRQELCEKAGLMGANAVIHIEDQKEHVFASAIRMSQSISIDAGSSTSSLTRTR